jgi:hypothetical protein
MSFLGSRLTSDEIPFVFRFDSRCNKFEFNLN